MASQSAGIQQLLQAEKRAAERVAEARKRETLIRSLVDSLGALLLTCCVKTTTPNMLCRAVSQEECWEL